MRLKNPHLRTAGALAAALLLLSACQSGSKTPPQTAQPPTPVKTTQKVKPAVSPEPGTEARPVQLASLPAWFGRIGRRGQIMAAPPGAVPPTSSQLNRAVIPAHIRLASYKVLPPQMALKTRPPLPVEDQLIKLHGFDLADVGYVLYDLQTGKKLTGRAETNMYLPASVSKVPSSLAALHFLGPDYRFETRLAIKGEVKDGVLEGDVFLIGGGDPLLEPANFPGFIAALKARGITRVKGRFVYDQSLFKVIREIEPAQPDDARYNPGVSALSFSFNRVLISWEPGKTPGTVKVTPTAHSDTAPIVLDSVLMKRTADVPPPGQRFIWRKTKNGGEWVFGKTLRAKGRGWLPVRNPGKVAADTLRKMAETAEIVLPKPVEAKADGDATIIFTHKSPPLSDIVRLVLKHSNNLAAELVGLAGTRKKTGKLLSLSESTDAITEWFRGQIPDAGWRGYIIDNHSGLTSKARVSPQQLAQILLFARKEKYGPDADYMSLLPRIRWGKVTRRIAREKAARAKGVKVEKKKGKQKAAKKEPTRKDGAKTVSMLDMPLQVYAKSGTIAFGRGLAGYLLTNDRRLLVFAIFVSDIDKRRAFDKKQAEFGAWRDPNAGPWMRRARRLEYTLLNIWASSY